MRAVLKSAAIAAIALTSTATRYAHPKEIPANHVSAGPAATFVRIRAGDLRSLQNQLLSLAQKHLQPLGLFVDQARARLSVSSPLDGAELYQTLVDWPAVSRPSLPLIFGLQPVLPQGSAVGRADEVAGQSIRATLVVALQRDVWVASRQLPKGSAVTCEDFHVERRDLSSLPRAALGPQCGVVAGAVVLHDIGLNDVIRSGDIGGEPDVSAGSRVRVSVLTGRISVTADAVALTDAQVGDEVKVLLKHPARTLRTRVVGRGTVQVMDGS